MIAPFVTVWRRMLLAEDHTLTSLYKAPANQLAISYQNIRVASTPCLKGRRPPPECSSIGTLFSSTTLSDNIDTISRLRKYTLWTANLLSSNSFSSIHFTDKDHLLAEKDRLWLKRTSCSVRRIVFGKL